MLLIEIDSGKNRKGRRRRVSGSELTKLKINNNKI